jgi:hypothetical protein
MIRRRARKSVVRDLVRAWAKGGPQSDEFAAAVDEALEREDQGLVFSDAVEAGGSVRLGHDIRCQVASGVVTGAAPGGGADSSSGIGDQI